MLFRSARRRLDLGDTTYVFVLTAELAYRQASLARIQAQAARYADTAALFQALGGGWWNRDEQDSDPARRLRCRPPAPATSVVPQAVSSARSAPVALSQTQ